MNSLDNIISIITGLLLVGYSISYYYPTSSNNVVNWKHTNNAIKSNITKEYDFELSNRIIQASLSDPVVRAFEDDYYEVEYLGGEYYLVRREDYIEDYDHNLDGPEIRLHYYNSCYNYLIPR